MTTRDEYTGYGTLADVIRKTEDVRDSLSEILEELEDMEDNYSFYRTDERYGLASSEENGNGD